MPQPNPCTLVRSENRKALLASARALAVELREAGDEIESERRIPPRIVEKFLGTGIWTMGHGAGVDILTRFEVVETIAAADGSAGWCTMLAGGNGGSGPPGFDTSAAREIFEDNRAVVAGASRPSGKAIPVQGGYRVTGVWPFMSGCNHAAWFATAAIVQDGDKPLLTEKGRPVIICCYFPRSDGEILDTWRTTGLKGTGSHDVRCTDIFVPSSRAFDFFSPQSVPVGHPIPPFEAVPGLGLIYHAAVVIGIAQNMLDTTLKYLNGKMGARGVDVSKEAQVQATIARAEALIGSSREYVWSVLSDICRTFDDGELPTLRQRALVRLSVSHAHDACVQAVDALYHISGGGSAYAKNGLDRPFRDIHTAVQHIVADYKTYEFAGRMLMGMKVTEPMF